MYRRGLSAAFLLCSSAGLLCAAVQTYSWTGAPVPPNVTHAVSAALGARGWNSVASGGDATVSVTVTESSRYAIESYVLSPLPTWRYREVWVQTTGATPAAGVPQLVGWSGNIGVDRELLLVQDNGDTQTANSQGVAVMVPQAEPAATNEGEPNTTVTQTVPETVRTMTIELRDRRTGQLLFRGQDDQVLSGNPRRDDHKLDHSVYAIFKRMEH